MFYFNQDKETLPLIVVRFMFRSAIRIESWYYSYLLICLGRIIMAESTIIVSGSREKINLSLSYLAT